MKFSKIFITLFCSTFLLCGCSLDGTILSVGDTKISRREFNKRYLEYKDIIFLNLRNKVIRNENNKYIHYKLRQKTAHYLIKNLVLEDEYKIKNITPTEQDLERIKKRFIYVYGSEEKILQNFRANSMDDKNIKDAIYACAKEDMLLRQAGLDKVHESELEKYYNKNINHYKLPASFEFSHILLRTNRTEIKTRLTEKDKKNKIGPLEMDKLIREELAANKKILKEIEGKITLENFSQMAKNYSQDEKTASKGGYAGWVEDKDLTGFFIRQVEKQPLETISPPIDTANGTEIIYLKNKKLARTVSLNEARDEIRAIVYHNKMQPLLDEYLEKVKATKKIKYYDKTLEPDYIPLSEKFTNIFKKKKTTKEGSNGASNK